MMCRTQKCPTNEYGGYQRELNPCAYIFDWPRFHSGDPIADTRSAHLNPATLETNATACTIIKEQAAPSAPWLRIIHNPPAIKVRKQITLMKKSSLGRFSASIP